MACIRIGIIPKALGNSAFELARIGAEEAIGELADAELLYTGPVRPTAEGQIKAIEDLSARGAHVLAINANDPQLLIPCVRRARTRGIQVLTWDSGMHSSGTLHLCPVKDETLAAVWLGLLADAIGGVGEFALLSTTDVAPNQNRWIDALRKLLTTPEFSHLRLVQIVYGEDVAEVSRARAFKLLQERPQLKGILALTGVGLAAAAAAIEENGLTGEAYATGLGYPSELLAFVERGVVKSFAVWSMIDLGYSTVYLAYRLATEAALGTAGARIEAGRMGYLAVDSNLEIAMAEPRIYDATNVRVVAQQF